MLTPEQLLQLPGLLVARDNLTLSQSKILSGMPNFTGTSRNHSGGHRWFLLWCDTDGFMLRELKGHEPDFPSCISAMRMVFGIDPTMNPPQPHIAGQR